MLTKLVNFLFPFFYRLWTGKKYRKREPGEEGPFG